MDEESEHAKAWAQLMEAGDEAGLTQLEIVSLCEIVRTAYQAHKANKNEYYTFLIYSNPGDEAGIKIMF